MITSSYRIDSTVLSQTADQAIIAEADEVQKLFDKHSKFSRQITNTAQ